jgi:hypothetical protein
MPTATSTSWCSSVVKIPVGATQLQTKEYLSSLEGKYIYFSSEADGEAHQFGDEYRIGLDVGYACHYLLRYVPYDVAIGIKEGQHVEGYGTISDIWLASVFVQVEIIVYPDFLIVR